MSASGLVVPSTRTSLGITSGGGTATGLLLVDARENVLVEYNAIPVAPAWGLMNPFNITYAPPSDGKIIVSACGLGLSDGSTRYSMTLFINGEEVATGSGEGLTVGVGSLTTVGNLFFTYPFSVQSGVSTDIQLYGNYRDDVGFGIYNVSWTVYFSAV